MSKLILALLTAVLGLALLAPPGYAQEEDELPDSICLLPEHKRPKELVEPVELCAETTLQASDSRVLRVSLPEDVTIAQSFGPEGAIDIEGEGPFVGFAMTDDPVPRAGGGRVLLAGRLHREPSPRELVVKFGDLGSPGATFPAGQYRLYLLASDSPVTVTLRLPQLEGWIDVTPSTPNRFDARSLEPRIWEEAGRVIYSAGEDGELRTHGLLLQSMWVNSSNHIASDRGTCMYDGPSPQPVAFLPECPDGAGWAWGPYVDVPPRTVNMGGYIVLWGYPPGTYGQGAWYVSASEVSSAGAVVFWLDLE